MLNNDPHEWFLLISPVEVGGSSEFPEFHVLSSLLQGKLRCRSEFEVIRKSPIKSVESSSSEAAQKISCRSI